MKDDHQPHDHFLATAVKSRDRHLSYGDGFRFGFGFFVSGVFVALILGGLAWGMIVSLHLH